MAILATLHPQHNQNTSDEWFRQYKHSGGLATPTSTTSQTSCNPFSRYQSVDSDCRSDRSLSKESTNMPPTQSPRHVATFLPSLANASRPSLPSIHTLLAEVSRSPQPTPLVPRTTQQHYSPAALESESERAHKRSCSNYAWDRRAVHASPISVHSLNSSVTDASIRRDSATQATIEQALQHAPKDVHPYPRPNASLLPSLKTAVHDVRPISPTRALPFEGPSMSRKRSYDSYAAPSAYERPAYLPPLSSATPRTQVLPRMELAAPTSQAPSHATSGMTVHRGEAYRPAPPLYAAPTSHRVAGGEGTYAPAGSASRPVYEYQLAKSRKRSNLPKESTDIMKRWFEEHLENPYPSEEEKKYFAQKAGINTTQVSNWFINHRRRCPELKEQRDKRPGPQGSRAPLPQTTTTSTTSTNT